MTRIEANIWMRIFRSGAWLDQGYYLFLTQKEWETAGPKIKEAGYRVYCFYDEETPYIVKLIEVEEDFEFPPESELLCGAQPKLVGFLFKIKGGKTIKSEKYRLPDSKREEIQEEAVRIFAEKMGWELHELSETRDGAGWEEATDPDGNTWTYGWTWPISYNLSWTGLKLKEKVAE